MKRIVVILLIFTHLFSAVGFSMNIHQCGGHKSYALFGFEIGAVCGCDHQDHSHSKDCCNDKKVVVKAQKKENVASKILVLKHFPVINFEPSFFCFQNVNVAVTIAVTIVSDHPPNHSPPLYLMYGVFRI